VETFWENKEIALYFVCFVLAVLLLILLYKAAKDLFVTSRFFMLGGLVIVAYVVAYFLNSTEFFQGRNLDPIVIPWAMFAFLGVLVLLDFMMLFGREYFFTTI